jgi:transcription antitermination factor NusG
MGISKQWYAIHTKPGWEKRVSDSLTKKQIENYCPLNRVRKGWVVATKIIELPLFISYVFVKSDDYKQIPIRTINGLINFIFWIKSPVVIPSEEITSIRDFLDNFENIQVEKMQFRSNDIVHRIENSQENKFAHLNSSQNNSVRILLPTIGYIMHSNQRTSEFDPNMKKEFSNSFHQKIKYAIR